MAQERPHFGYASEVWRNGRPTEGEIDQMKAALPNKALTTGGTAPFTIAGQVAGLIGLGSEVGLFSALRGLWSQ